MNTMRSTSARSAAAFAAVGLSVALLAACGGGSSSSSNTTVPKASDLAAQCPVDALAKAAKPVHIVYWHAMTQANEDTLKTITAQFNASQHDVQVTLVAQGGYDDNLTKFRTVAGTGDAPNLIQIEDTATQQMIDSGAVVPAEACVAAAKADLSDIVPRVRDYYTVGKVLYPVPFNVSNPVFYYNKLAFQKAGLDPAKPPTDFAQVIADSRKLKASGLKYGFYYKRDPWVLEQFLALDGEPYVNNGNGRDKRATAVMFDTPFAHQLFHDFDTLVSEGLAGTNPASGQSEYDNLLSICNGTAAMTIDTSAALGTAYQVLNSGGCKAKVSVGVAPLPGASGKGGVLVGGAANYIVHGKDPAKVAAAWKFAQYLTTPSVQAAWGAGTGYVPISKASVQLPAIKKLWKDRPGYQVAYEQLVTGKENVATAGPVIGDYQGVRNATKNALESFLIGSSSPDAAITKAVTQANAAIEAYNSRVG